MTTESEIPKHRKSTGSNISWSNQKSKHKHHYEECLIQYDSSFGTQTYRHTRLHSYCTICGKINERFKEDKSIVKDFTRKIDTSIGECISIIPGIELYEKYHDKLPVFFVGDIYKEKYVNLEQNGK